jgi:hypothetical protein
MEGRKGCFHNPGNKWLSPGKHAYTHAIGYLSPKAFRKHWRYMLCAKSKVVSQRTNFVAVTNKLLPFSLYTYPKDIDMTAMSGELQNGTRFYSLSSYHLFREKGYPIFQARVRIGFKQLSTV